MQEARKATFLHTSMLTGSGTDHAPQEDHEQPSLTRVGEAQSGLGENGRMNG